MGLPPDIINERGTLPGNTGLRTALHFGSGHATVVRTLLERGADPNIRDEGDNAFPIHFAAERGDLAVVTLLVEHGADPVGAATTHDLDALGWAVCFDHAMHLDVARHLLAHGARHTVFSAVAMGDADAIRALAAAGGDLNQRRYSRDIWTLCFHAYVERVREILREDCRCAQVVSKDGCTPLWWLPDDEAKAMRIVDLLLAAGADPAVKNKDGGTAADWARRRGMRDVASRLESADPSP